MKTINLVLALTLSLMLAACGGGGSGGSSNTNHNTPPDSNDDGQVGDEQAGGGSITPPATDPDIAPQSLSRLAPVSNCEVTQMTGGVQDQNLRIEELSWLQVVQQDVDDEDTALAADKTTRIRVDVITTNNNVAAPSDAKLVLGTSDGTCHEISLTMGSDTAPTTVDRASLSKAYVGMVPANLMTTDVVTYQVVINGAVASTEAAADRLYRQGTMNVQPRMTDKLVIRPMAFMGQVGYFPSDANLTGLIKRAYPQVDFTVEHAMAFTPQALTDAFMEGRFQPLPGNGYLFSEQVMQEAMSELVIECRDRNPESVLNDGNGAARLIRCLAAFPDNIEFAASNGGRIVGLGDVNGLMNVSFNATDDHSVTTPYSIFHWISQEAAIFLHEFGHVMNVGHADCGSPPGIDARLYPDGRLGSNGGGYDEGRQFYFNVAGGQFSDFMGYCGKPWTSDITYREVIKFKNLPVIDPIVVGFSPQARTSGHEHHHHASSETVKDGRPSQQLVMFYKKNGKWEVRLSRGVPNMVRSSKMPYAGFISPALASMPVYVHNIHIGELSSGPYYIEATPEVLNLLRSGILGPIDLRVK